MRATGRPSTALAAMTLLLGAATGQSRKIIVKNSCGMKVYAAHAANNNAGSKVDGQAGVYGWEIPKDGQSTLEVPEGWDSGRIWIRSGGEGCASDVTKCLLGKCPGGGLACEATPDYGVAPGVTVRPRVFREYGLMRKLAEISLNKYAGQDFYDVSMVEGFTVPVTITPSDSSCNTPSCGIDLDPLKNCDARLALPIGTDKFWSCGDPCTAKVQFSMSPPAHFTILSGLVAMALMVGELAGTTFQGDQVSPSCCGGAWRDEKCTRDVVPFYDDLKKLCKMGYVYAKDDLPLGGEQTAVWTCPAAGKPSYTVEFCAGGVNTGLINPPPVKNGKPMNPGSHGPLNVQGNGGDGVPFTSDGPSVISVPVPSILPKSSTTALPPKSSDAAVGPSSSTKKADVVVTVSTVVIVQTSDTDRWGKHGWAGGMQQAPSATASCARKRRKRGVSTPTA